MAQSAVVRDYRALEVGRRRANRLSAPRRRLRFIPKAFFNDASARTKAKDLE
jgi:hypothetical protein